MDTSSLIELEVNAISHHNGIAPKANHALQACFAAELVRKNILGVTTVTRASIVTGLPRVDIDNALLVLESGDDSLLCSILDGFVTLSRAAKVVKNRVKLIRAFENAAPDDRVALVNAVGVNEVFDTVLVPALNHLTDRADAMLASLS